MCSGETARHGGRSRIVMSAESTNTLIIEGEWEPWFAWRPVRLYSTARLIWLRRIHRRGIVKFGLATCEYTDAPDEFPSYRPD
jgi:hypothetical protein